MKPTLTIIAGPARSGKTWHCIERAIGARSPTRVVFPTSSAAETAQSALAASGYEAPNASFQDFLGLIGDLAKLEANLPLEIDPARRAALCGRICRLELKSDSFFGKVREMPGFHARLCRFFDDLTMDGLDADALELASELTAKGHAPPELGLDKEPIRDHWLLKMRELASLWREYRKALKEGGRCDLADLVKAAHEGIEKARTLPFAQLILDGFEGLRRVEAAILKQLALRRVRLVMTILDDPDRPRLFAVCQRFLASLSLDFDLDVHSLPAKKKGSQALTLLERRLFESIEQPGMVDEADVTILDAPSVLAEVESIVRTVRKLIDSGAKPEQVALIVREPERYRPFIDSLAARYSVPINGSAQEPISHSPIGRRAAELLDLLTLPLTNQRLTSWFSSAFWNLSRSDQAALRRASRRLRKGDELTNAVPERYETAKQYAQQLYAHRKAFLATSLGASPPARIFDAFQEALKALLLGKTPHLDPREAAASEALHRTAAAQSEYLPPMSARQWSEAMSRLWRETRYAYQLGQSGVRLISPDEPDLGSMEIAFMLGVKEAIYPRRVADDPFLGEAERAALSQAIAGNPDAFPDLSPRFHLRNRQDHADLERLLFYRAAAAPNKSLWLSFPRADSESEELASFFIGDVQRAVGPGGYRTLSLRVDDICPPEFVANDFDAQLREAIESDQLDPLPSFALQDPAARDFIAKVDRIFSVRELETLGACPFRHFAQHRLRLRTERYGMSIDQIGDLAHQAIQRAYKNLPPEADAATRAKELIEELDRLMAESPLPGEEWQLMLIKEYCEELLRLLAERESLYQEQFQTEPLALEWAFGMKPRPDIDPSSVAPPLEIRSQHGSVFVSGIVDRVDRAGDAMMVIDYKLTGSSNLNDDAEMRSLQPIFYSRAVRENLGAKQVVFAFDSLTEAKRARIVPFELSKQFNQMDWERQSRGRLIELRPNIRLKSIETRAEQHVIGLVQQLKNAEIAAQPGDHCALCPYGDFCRMAQR
ncbi:MAG: PD-(D/E)XK nuclease family protein [Armatimonadetes bacterium]|nr:PD-(D/E)XK nuclease family protein [Armatimonadota bacterium]